MKIFEKQLMIGLLVAVGVATFSSGYIVISALLFAVASYLGNMLSRTLDV